jgi:hypothetical protein
MKDVVSRKKIAQQQGISTGAKDEPLVEDTQKKIKRSNIQTFNKVRISYLTLSVSFMGVAHYVITSNATNIYERV